MKPILSLLLFLTMSSLSQAAESKPGTRPVATSTNDMEICADGPPGLVYSNDTMTCCVNVRVTNGPTILTCERLTVIFQTNRTSKPDLNQPAAPVRSATAGPQTNPVSTKVERILAETNVVITQFDNRAKGDRAVYTASNDVVELTGRLVVMETVQGTLECTKVILDRGTGHMTALSVPGPVRMRLRADAFGQPGVGFLSTNALRLPGTRKPSTNAPPPTR